MTDEFETEAFDLFCVVGQSPQVVSETIYGLAVVDTEESPGLPVGDVYTITTTGGNEYEIPENWSWETPEGSVDLQTFLRHFLEKMREMYPEAAERLPELQDIQAPIIPENSEGVPIEDVRTVEQTDAMALAIHEWVVEHTSSQMPRLWASIAGGRKAMSYFLGNAMTLFGRPQDRMSHVLLGGEFGELAEKSRKRCFHFPHRGDLPEEERTLKTWSRETFPADEVEVDLYEVPFVGLDDILEQVDLRNKQEVSDIGEWIRSAREGIGGASYQLTIDMNTGSVRYAGHWLRFHSPAERTFYIVLALEHKLGNTPISSKEFVRKGGKEEREYFDALELVFSHVLGHGEEARAENGLVKEPGNDGYLRKLKEKVIDRINQNPNFDAAARRPIRPETVTGQGYTLEIEPDRIVVKNDELYAPGEFQNREE